MATRIPDNFAEFSALEVVDATGGRLVRRRSGDLRAVGFVTDSRAVRPGNGFVALVGPAFDGHHFLKDAIGKGASILVVRRGASVPEADDVDVVEVSDTLTAWGDLARFHLRRWRGSRERTATVAITGSAGKTTTKELTFALLRARGECHASVGNLNNRVGVPAVALGVTAVARFAVFETGMSERGEIAELARIVAPDVGVLINVGLAHAGGVGGSREDVAREKGALLAALDPATAVAVVNMDDDAAFAQASRTGAQVRTFGKHLQADYRLMERRSLGEGGSSVTLRRASEQFDVALPLLGEEAALDLMAALAAAEAAAGENLTPSLISRALAGCGPVDGRARLKRLGHDILAIDDTYNANPSSMRAALKTLVELGASGRRKVAVLGEMRELGSAEVEEHRALGEALSRAGVALAIGCGGLVEHALDKAAALGVSITRAGSTEEAALIAQRDIRAGDVVLLKGSRSIGVERVLSALLEVHGSG